MAASNVDNSENLPTADDNTSEVEKSEFEFRTPSPDMNKSNTSGVASADVVGHGDFNCAPSPHTNINQTEKNSKFSAHCNTTKWFITIILVMAVLLAAIVAGMGVYVSQLHVELRRVNDRMDKLETQCNSVCATSSENNETRGPFDLKADGDLQASISNLSMKIERLEDNVSTIEKMIQAVQAKYENDTNQIRTNMVAMLAEVNVSLSNSLSSLAIEVSSNISKINETAQQEISGVRNYLPTLSQNISALNNQVLTLDERLHNLEVNATELRRNFDEQLSKIMVNLSSNVGHLRDITSVQVEQTAKIERIESNISLVEDHFDQQLIDMREYINTAVSELNSNLSEIDANLISHLKNVSSGLAILNRELVVTKEAVFTSVSAVEKKLTGLSENLTHTSEQVVNLSFTQEELVGDLANVKVIQSSNISSIGQSLVDLNLALTEINENLWNLSTSLQHDLGRTNEALLSNISALDQKVDENITLTQMHLQNVSFQLTEIQFDLTATRDALEANVSSLQGSLGHIEGDLGLTKTELRNLSSLHANLQHSFSVTRQDFYTTREVTEQNASRLYELIHHVQQNHSLVLGEHSRRFVDAARNTSVLTRMIDSTSNMVSSQGQIIGGMRSGLSTLETGVTNLRGTLNRNVEQLNTRIDDHVSWIQHSLDSQTGRFARIETRVGELEKNDAVRVVPLGFFLLSAISLLVCHLIG